MRKLLPFLLLTGLAVPLIGCGGESETMEPKEGAMDEAAGEVEHGSMSGDKDSQGDGAGEGAGEKHK
jgi:hypothetical protein